VSSFSLTWDLLKDDGLLDSSPKGEHSKFSSQSSFFWRHLRNQMREGHLDLSIREFLSQSFQGVAEDFANY
jgi:hypothetical protein